MSVNSNMHLIHNWRQILRRAWSMRLMLLAGVLTALEAILPLFIEAIPRNLFAIITIFTIMGAMVARVVAQKELKDD